MLSGTADLFSLEYAYVCKHFSHFFLHSEFKENHNTPAQVDDFFGSMDIDEHDFGSVDIDDEDDEKNYQKKQKRYLFGTVNFVAICLVSIVHIFHLRSQISMIHNKSHERLTMQTSDDEEIRNWSTQQLTWYLLVDVLHICNTLKYFHYSESENSSDNISESYKNSKLQLRSKTNMRKEMENSDADSENSSIHEVSESSSNSGDVNLNNCLKKGNFFLFAPRMFSLKLKMVNTWLLFSPFLFHFILLAN